VERVRWAADLAGLDVSRPGEQKEEKRRWALNGFGEAVELKTPSGP
jgi:hypothetical protein